jgi:hypothetical protein
LDLRPAAAAALQGAVQEVRRISRQPVWKLLANLGDISPFDYGGYFVYLDETGMYPEEAELLELENENEEDEEKIRYTVRRFVLERCTLVDGVLSDNKFHPDHPA